MYLPNVWELCTFSDEIGYGKFDMSKFAVELHSVLDNLVSVAVVSILLGRRRRRGVSRMRLQVYE